MASLSHIEKQKLERELGMASGRVLEFSNRTFEEFFREVVGVEIYDSKFDHRSGSKANRMRAFWQVASPGQIMLLLGGLQESWEFNSSEPIPDSANSLFTVILNRLGGGVASKRGEPELSKEPSTIVEDLAKFLSSKLLALGDLAPQKRGYEFERFLKEMFSAYGLSACSSFRLQGEQIDGSLTMDKETYLLEAKWQNAPTGAADLHIFEGKLRERASWSRGLFVSHSGFTADGLHAFGRGKKFVCMDGFDLFEMLRMRLSIRDVLGAKIKSAVETGSPFTSVRDLF